MRTGHRFMYSCNGKPRICAVNRAQGIVYVHTYVCIQGRMYTYLGPSIGPKVLYMYVRMCIYKDVCTQGIVYVRTYVCIQGRM